MNGLAESTSSHADGEHDLPWAGVGSARVAADVPSEAQPPVICMPLRRRGVGSACRSHLPSDFAARRALATAADS